MWRFLWKPTMSHLLSAKMSRNGGTRQAARAPLAAPGGSNDFCVEASLLLRFLPHQLKRGNSGQPAPDRKRRSPRILLLQVGVRGVPLRRGAPALLGSRSRGGESRTRLDVPATASWRRRLRAAPGRVCAHARPPPRASRPTGRCSSCGLLGLRPALALLFVLTAVLSWVLTPSVSAMPFLLLPGHAERLPSLGRRLRHSLCLF